MPSREAGSEFREQRKLKEFEIGSTNLKSFLATFTISFGFYMLLANKISLYEVSTGVFSSLVAAAFLSKLQFTQKLSLRTPVRLARFLVYMPLLSWEIVKANIRVAGLIIRPSMPVNPQMFRIKPDLEEGLQLTVLANSITLTPGTLSAKVEGDELLVHALDDEAKEDLLTGTMERRVDFVFNGRGDGK